MDEHRDAELAALVPDRIEPRVVHGDALAGRVDDGEPQVLEDLQAPRAVLVVLAELRDRALGPAGAADSLEVQVGEDHEAARIPARQVPVALLELGALVAAQVDHDLHVDPVHVRDQLRRVRGRDVRVLVVVDVDEGVLRVRRVVLGHDQGRLGLVLLDRHRLRAGDTGRAGDAEKQERARDDPGTSRSHAGIPPRHSRPGILCRTGRATGVARPAACGHCTTTVPVIIAPCTMQKYGKVPAWLKVWENVIPLPVPESQTPSGVHTVLHVPDVVE